MGPARSLRVPLLAIGHKGVGLELCKARAVVLLHIAAGLVDRDPLRQPRLAAWNRAAPAGVLVREVAKLLRIKV
eukprot:6967611-Alexandrium_andersonii.AAC.1